MDTKPFAAKYGFGLAYSRHIVVEQNGKLWLAFASEGAGAFMMSSASLAAGLLEINLIHNGQSIPYTFEASEAILEITSEYGKVYIVVDADAHALRLSGEGVSIRLDSKNTEQATTNLNMKDGTVISMGGGRYFFTAKRGGISFDDTWVRNRFRSTPPVLDIIPDGGKFELIAYDLPADTEAPEITKTIEECAEENAQNYKSFCDSLAPTSEEWVDIREKIAYLLWVNQRNFNGVNVIPENKLLSAEVDSVKLSTAALAFMDATRAAELITASQGISPVAQASAVLRLFDDGLFSNVSRKTVFDLYAALSDNVNWWTKNRTGDDPALYFYAYRYEAGAGAKEANALFRSGAPVYSPDINTHIILACAALAKLTEFTGNTAEAAKWIKRAEATKKAMISNLWDGNKFMGKNVYSGLMVDAGEAIALSPIALGAMLPKEISSVLAAGIDTDICDTVIIMGLRSAGYEKQAKRIVTAQLNKIRKAGVSDLFTGAALLALAGKQL